MQPGYPGFLPGHHFLSLSVILYLCFRKHFIIKITLYLLYFIRTHNILFQDYLFFCIPFGIIIEPIMNFLLI